MRPLVYFNIEVAGSSMQSAAASQSLPVLARLLRTLHGYFSQHPHKFAIAFPRLRKGEFRHPGNVIRVFAEKLEDFVGLVAYLENDQRIWSYIRVDYPRMVDITKIKGWLEYRRFRIPSQKTRTLICRDHRIKVSEEVPFLRISSSNKNSFSMHIDAIPSEKTEKCEPTSYGLSGCTRFSLPDIK